MALPKLFSLITWHNNASPALNEDNLNSMSQAIDDIDNRVIALASDVVTAVTECNTDAASAEASATSAANSAATATNKANQAINSATSAADSAATATNKASEAIDSAATASTKASQAANSATNAANSATTATDKASEAANSATSAAESASQAAAWSAHPPYIGANGNWYVYDVNSSAYVDSHIDASINISIGATTTLEPGNNASVTNTGTNTDPIFNFQIPQGEPGDDGTSPSVEVATTASGHRVTITDADHPEGQSFEVLNGDGAGDMLSNIYDPNGSVATAGGIEAFMGTARSEVKAATLATGATSVTFNNLPTEGNYIIAFFASTGINYTAIDTSTPGQVTLTYSAQASPVTIYCEIKAVEVESGTTPTYTKGFRDLTVIPDKYNTGCDESLIDTVITADNTADFKTLTGIAMRNNGQINFQYDNSKLATETVINNMQFDLTITMSTWSNGYDEIKTIIFNNCKFKSVGLGFEFHDKILNTRFVFNNCSFTYVSGSHGIFNNCYFGGGNNSDGIQPAYDVTLNNCYISDLLRDTGTASSAHVDGIQCFNPAEAGSTGHDYKGGKFSFNNLRVEMPDSKGIPNRGGVTGCINVEIREEFLDSLSIEHSVVNGGSYSLYIVNPIIGNALVRDIQVGASRKYGMMYPYTAEDAAGYTLEDIRGTDSLYIGSVWKSNGVIHMSVTNDTAEERTLVIRTSDGDTTVTVPGVPAFADTTDYTFADFPFDIDTTVTSDSTYVVCFDNTDNDMKQIRYVDFTE